MSLEELKQQYIKTFEAEGSYIHRDDLDLLIETINETLTVITDHETRIKALEAK